MSEVKMNFKSKLDRDKWIQNADNDAIIKYFDEHKPELLKKARKTMGEEEIVEWCRLLADFTVAGTKYEPEDKH